MLSGRKEESSTHTKGGLNAPFGARCFLTWKMSLFCVAAFVGLNAPYGARCFLTQLVTSQRSTILASLNTPYDARCFLTDGLGEAGVRGSGVLMHRLALGAF